MEEARIKTTTSRQICCCTTLQKCSTMQICRTVNSVQSDAKTFNYSKCLLAMFCYFFVHAVNLQHCLKCVPLGRMPALNRACYWSVDASIMCCSVLC